VIGDLNARALIMSDREDKLVPSEESRRLAEDLDGRGNVYHTEFSLFDHVTPGKTVGPREYVREMYKMFRHMYMVMRELD